MNKHRTLGKIKEQTISSPKFFFPLRRSLKSVYSPATMTACHGWKEMIDVARNLWGLKRFLTRSNRNADRSLFWLCMLRAWLNTFQNRLWGKNEVFWHVKVSCSIPAHTHIGALYLTCKHMVLVFSLCLWKDQGTSPWSWLRAHVLLKKPSVAACELLLCFEKPVLTQPHRDTSARSGWGEKLSQDQLCTVLCTR